MSYKCSKCKNEYDEVDKRDVDMIQLTQMCDHCWRSYPSTCKETWANRIIAEARAEAERKKAAGWKADERGWIHEGTGLDRPV